MLVLTREKQSYYFYIIIIVLSVTAMTACSGGGGGSTSGTTPPFIYAELVSFPTGSIPPGMLPAGFNSMATVFVMDVNTNEPIINAAVTINGAALTYNADDQSYEGVIAADASGHVTLQVAAMGGIYTASATELASYPAIAAPVSGATWPTGCPTSILWSAGTPTANAYYGIGILDASDPNGPLVWPENGYLNQVPMGTNSRTIPADSLRAGNLLAIIGMYTDEPVSNAAPGSTLSIGGFGYVPFTASDSDILFDISVSPSSAVIPKGATQQFTATGTSCINRSLSSQDITSSATWTSNPVIAVVSNGMASSVTSGTTMIRATSGNVSGAASLTVTGWTVADSGITNDLYGVASSGTTLVAVGDGGTVITSSDAALWTSQTLTNASYLRSVIWAGSRFVTVGRGVDPGPFLRDTSIIYTSPDGITWTEQSYSGFPTNAYLFGVTWSGSQFVTVGENATIFTSPDGVNWTPSTWNPSSGIVWNLYGVASSGSKFVAVGENTIIISTDGANWTEQSGTAYIYFYGVTWTGNQFVAAGQDILKDEGVLFTSPDGITWTRQSPGIAYPVYQFSWLFGITASGNNLAAVGLTQSPWGHNGPGIILTSSDGVSWTQPASGMTLPQGPFNGVTWYGTHLVIVGAGGTILISP